MKSQGNRHNRKSSQESSLIFTANSGRREAVVQEGWCRSSGSRPAWLRKKLFDELKLTKEGKMKTRKAKKEEYKALFRNSGTKSGRPELT